VVGRRERPHDVRCDNGAGVVVGGGIGERPLQGRGTSVVADPGRCPGLGEAALQAACLSKLISRADQPLPCGCTPATDPPGRVPAREQPNLEYGASAVFPCGGTPATDPPGRAPAREQPNLEYGASAVFPCGGTPATDPPGRAPAREQPNLEYGASAVFPCGGTPATDPQGRAPALGRCPNYASRVFLKINRRGRRGLPEDIASVRERGRSDRPLALTAWEDGGRAVLQVEAAPPKFGGVWSMAVTCQHNDGNLLFPHPRPSPATTVIVFGTAARAGEGGRWPTAVPNAVPTAVPNAVPHAVPNADELGRTRTNSDERGRTTRNVPSRDRASPKRACRARSDSPGRRPGLRPPRGPAL